MRVQGLGFGVWGWGWGWGLGLQGCLGLGERLGVRRAGGWAVGGERADRYARDVLGVRTGGCICMYVRALAHRELAMQRARDVLGGEVEEGARLLADEPQRFDDGDALEDRREIRQIRRLRHAPQVESARLGRCRVMLLAPPLATSPVATLA